MAAAKAGSVGVSLACWNCGCVQPVILKFPDPVPPVGVSAEIAVTCDACERSQWMTLTLTFQFEEEEADGRENG